MKRKLKRARGWSPPPDRRRTYRVACAIRVGVNEYRRVCNQRQQQFLQPVNLFNEETQLVRDKFAFFIVHMQAGIVAAARGPACQTKADSFVRQRLTAPCRGALSLWDVPADVEARDREQLERAP